MDPDKTKQDSSEIPPVPQLSANPMPSADPTTVPPPPVSASGERDPVKDAQYAQSLIQMTNMKYEMEQTNKPKGPVISTKKLIYLGVVVLVTILSLVIGTILLKGKSANLETQTSQLDAKSINFNGRP